MSIKNENNEYIIHYCWFGNKKKPRYIKRCISSWKKIKGYRIIEWNESNFDVSSVPFVREAYRLGYYAFVSDYVRCWALYNFGGIYLDTDEYVIKNFINFVSIPFLPLESSSSVTTVCMAFRKKDKLLCEILDFYENTTFSVEESAPTIFVGLQFTRYFKERGLNNFDMTQVIDGYTIYSSEYFVPKRWNWRYSDHYKSSKTFGIHLFAATWKQKNKLSFKTVIYKYLSFVFGLKVSDSLKKIFNHFHSN